MRRTRRRGCRDFIDQARRGTTFRCRAFHFGSGYTQHRQAPLRVHVEPRQVSRRRARSIAAVQRAQNVRSSPTSSPACSTIIRPTPRSRRHGAFVNDARTGTPCVGQFWDGVGRARRLHASRRRSRWWQRGPARAAARLRHRRRLERQQRVRDLGRGRRLARLRHADPDRRARGRCSALLMTRATCEAQARAPPGRARVHGHARGPARHPALRADLVGRQHDELAHAALEHPHGPDDEPVGHVQHRPRRRRLPRPGARRRAARALGAERRVQPALHHELVEGGRRGQHAVAAPAVLPIVRDCDPLALSADALPVHAVLARGANSASRCCGRCSTNFDDDPRAFDDSDDFMLGPNLLVASVVRARATRARGLSAASGPPAGSTSGPASTIAPV